MKVELNSTEKTQLSNLLNEIPDKSLQMIFRRIFYNNEDIGDAIAKERPETTINEKPQFKHDCNRCVFLGRYKDHDLYVCQNSPTVIARFSDDGPDYMSGIVFARNNDIIAEGLKRALAKGLLGDRYSIYLP